MWPCGTSEASTKRQIGKASRSTPWIRWQRDGSSTRKCNESPGVDNVRTTISATANFWRGKKMPEPEAPTMHRTYHQKWRWFYVCFTKVMRGKVAAPVYHPCGDKSMPTGLPPRTICGSAAARAPGPADVHRRGTGRRCTASRSVVARAGTAAKQEFIARC